ncbi:enoyl-CoA hydratase/isomerase family protein [Curtobacterium flaccumfaciens]|uniref:enoyl-CoA hydratase/isomerase family protein n=1 Tax=Curtobacterium flaccumfaciens TaxID=2035 RepID=UPI001BDF3DA9|nr:enoyl-CoA hydratase/isomerase family protein [Curtobacterium flaccumfaciens]MBT1672831.1 enoyl-CoA hydratase/isomerase family protein [Curtobacterium flaccumfaciens pv. flaccumfaciens]
MEADNAHLWNAIRAWEKSKTGPQRLPAPIVSALAEYREELGLYLGSDAGHALIDRAVDRANHGHVSIELVVRNVQADAPARFPPEDIRLLKAGLSLRERAGLDLGTGLTVQAILRHTSGIKVAEAARVPAQSSTHHVRVYQQTGRLDLACVSVARQSSGVALVELNRPEKLNAETLSMLTSLEIAVDAVALDPASLGAVLRGGRVSVGSRAGRRVFSSGIDLDHLVHGRIPLLRYMVGRELGFIQKMRLGPLVRGVAAFKPWVTVVDGYAIGGGFQMALAGAAVVADDEAYFSLPALKEGFVPGVSALRLTRRFGSQLARRMILNPVPIAIDQARSIGLVSEVAGEKELGREAEALVMQLSGESARANIELLNSTEEAPHEFLTFLADFAAEQGRLLHSASTISALERWWA